MLVDNQQEFALLWAGDIPMVTIPTVPAIVTETFLIFHTPFLTFTVPFDIGMIILAFVINIPEGVIRSLVSGLNRNIASILRTARNDVGIFYISSTVSDVSMPIDLQQVILLGWAFFQNPESFRAGSIGFSIVPEEIRIYSRFGNVHFPTDTIIDIYSVKLSGVFDTCNPDVV